MTGIEDELTELLIDTVDVGIAWGSPTVSVAPAVRAILERWDLTPKVPEHAHSWVDFLDGDMKCSSCPAVHHYSM